MEMALDRRRFIQFAGIGTVGVAVASVPFETGCSFSSVFTDIENYAPVAVSSFTAVVNILTGAGVINPIEGSAILLVVNSVKAAIADIGAAVQQYQNAPATQKATLLGKISTAIAAAEAEIQQFWNDVSIPDAKMEALIQGLLGVIISTLQGFAAALPAPAPTAVAAKRAKLGRVINVVPQRRSVKTYKKDFNAFLVSQYDGKYAGYVIH